MNGALSAKLANQHDGSIRMGLDTIDKITREANDLRHTLEGAGMRWTLADAEQINSSLKAFDILVDRVKEEMRENDARVREVLEGLLAAWPHSEIVDYYKPQNKSVLMKHEALKRAAAHLRDGLV